MWELTWEGKLKEVEAFANYRELFLGGGNGKPFPDLNWNQLYAIAIETNSLLERADTILRQKCMKTCSLQCIKLSGIVNRYVGALEIWASKSNAFWLIIICYISRILLKYLADASHSISSRLILRIILQRPEFCIKPSALLL